MSLEISEKRPLKVSYELIEQEGLSTPQRQYRAAQCSTLITVRDSFARNTFDRAGENSEHASPEHIFSELSTIPGSNLVREIVISEQVGPTLDVQNPFHTGVYASSSQFRSITLRRPKKAGLRKHLIHEIAHIAFLTYETEAYFYRLAVKAEALKDPNAESVGVDEDWALHLSQLFQHADTTNNEALMSNKPIRSAILLRALMRANNDSHSEPDIAISQFVEQHQKSVNQSAVKCARSLAANEQMVSNVVPILLELGEESDLQQIAPLVSSLNISGGPFGNRHGNKLRHLTNLVELDLRETFFFALGFEFLRDFNKLKKLNLNRTKCNDAILEDLDSLGIEELSIADTLVTDRVVRILLRFPALRSVDITNCNISSTATEALATKFEIVHGRQLAI